MVNGRERISTSEVNREEKKSKPELIIVFMLDV
jgi:hypothetical protein